MISILPTSTDRATRGIKVTRAYHDGCEIRPRVDAYGNFPRTHVAQASPAPRACFGPDVRPLPTRDGVGRWLLCYTAPGVTRRSGW